MQQSYISSKYSQTILVWAAVVVAFGVFAFLYQDSIVILFKYWNDYGTYSHGYLTVLLSIFLIYTCIKWERFHYSGPSVFSAVCIAGLSLVWLVAYLANVNTIQMLCIPFFVYFTLTCFTGLKNYRTLLVPVFILLFTVPIWQSILPALQSSAVYVTDKLLSVSSLEYRVVDNLIIFSKGIFEIEESCSGLRYLLVGVLLSIVYGFLNYKSSWSTLVLVLTSIMIMLVGNYIRILIVIGLGVIKGMDYPLVQDHENLGWVLFAFLLIPLFSIARYLNPNIWQNSNSQLPKVGNTRNSTSISRLLSSLILYLVVVASAPLYANYIKDNISEMAVLSKNSMQSGESSGLGWEGPSMLSSRWAPSYSSYSDKISEQYVKNEKAVVLNAFLYTKQVPRGELINANNQLVDENNWRVTESSVHQLVEGNEKANSAVVNMLTIQSTKKNECLRIWYWFTVDGEVYTKKWQVKLNETIMIFKGKSGSALTSISTSCDDNPDLILNDFLFTNFVQLNNLIDW